MQPTMPVVEAQMMPVVDAQITPSPMPVVDAQIMSRDAPIDAAKADLQDGIYAWVTLCGVIPGCMEGEVIFSTDKQSLTFGPVKQWFCLSLPIEKYRSDGIKDSVKYIPNGAGTFPVGLIFTSSKTFRRPDAPCCDTMKMVRTAD